MRRNIRGSAGYEMTDLAEHELGTPAREIAGRRRCGRRLWEEKMTKPLAAQKTVLEAILEWSINRPAWQCDALRRIISKGRLDDDDFKELVQLCKIGRGAESGSLKAIPLEREHLPASPEQDAAVTLIFIADVSGA